MIKKRFFGVALMLVFIISPLFSSESREVILSAMETCVKTVVPAVFPFAVLGSLVGSNVAEFPGFLTRALSKLFGVGSRGAGALLPGLFMGFPVGASGACGLYEREEISERELYRICSFSATPSAVFVLYGVGVGFFGSLATGVGIYLSVISAVFLVGIFTKGKRKKEKEPKEICKMSVGFSQALTKAISGSGYAMLTMTAFVSFFSYLSFLMSRLLDLFDAGGMTRTLIIGFFEVTLGCKSSADIGNSAGKILATSFCAWSGLSLELQTLAITSVCNTRSLFKNMFFLRTAICLVATVISTLAVLVFRLY